MHPAGAVTRIVSTPCPKITQDVFSEYTPKHKFFCFVSSGIPVGNGKHIFRCTSSSSNQTHISPDLTHISFNRTHISSNRTHILFTVRCHHFQSRKVDEVCVCAGSIRTTHLDQG